MVYGFGLVAFCLAWLLPGHYFPWYSFQQEALAAVGAALLSLGALVSTGRQPLRVAPAAGGAALLALVPLGQWLFGGIPFFTDALVPALYLLGFAVTVVSAMALEQVEGERVVLLLVSAVVLAATVSTTLAMAQWLRLDWIAFTEQIEAGTRVSGNLLQANNLACLISLALVGIWWLYESRRVGAVGSAALGAFLAIGLAMTQSRAAWGVVVSLALWWWLGRRQAQLRTPALGVVFAVALFTAIAAALPWLAPTLDAFDATAITDRFQTAGKRLVHWPAMWDAAWRQPFAGWGWMQVSAAQQAVALDHPPSHEWITYSHNAVLDLMVWMGALPGLAVSLAITWWIVARILACRDATTWAALGMLAVVLVHSLVEFPYAYSYFLFPLAVAIGVVESRSGVADRAAFAMPRAAFAAAGAGLVAMLAWICVEYLAVEEMAQRTRFREANYVVPASQMPRPPDVLLLDIQREFIRFRLTKARRGMPAAELDNIERINRRFMPPAVLLRYAMAMGLNGRPEDASRNLRLICHIWKPKHCEEGQASWASAQEKFPELKAIAFPHPKPAP